MVKLSVITCLPHCIHCDRAGKFVPFRSISFHFVPFRSISFHFVPFRSISFHFVPFHSIHSMKRGCVEWNGTKRQRGLRRETSPRPGDHRIALGAWVATSLDKPPLGSQIRPLRRVDH